MRTSIIISTLIFITLISTILLGQNPREIKSLRNHYSKTFFNDQDSTYTTQISSNLIHYKDKDGKFQPIETNIVPSTNQEYKYEVSKGVYKTYFKSDISSTFPVKFERSSGRNFQIQPYAIGYIDLTTRKKRILAQVKSNQPKVQNNEITYPAIFPGVDLKYKYLEKKLKEEIILTTKFRNNLPPPSQFGFNDNSTILVVLNKIDFSNGLDLVEQDSLGISNNLVLANLNDYTAKKRLKFKIRNKLQYMLPVDVAYMQQQDSSAISKVVPLKRRIKRINGELNLLTGINYSELKAFPAGNVILDPTVETEFEAVEDVWLENQYNKNSYNFLIIAKTGYYPKKRSVLKFDLSSLPSNAGIESANFKIYHHSNGRVGTPTWQDRPTHVHRILKPWVENTATRDNPWYEAYGRFFNPEYESIPGDWGWNSYASATITQSYKWENFDVQSLVEEWHDGTYQNFGMMIYATNEDISSYDVRFRSSEYSDPTYRPQLEITYTRDFVRNYYLKDHLGNIRVTVDEDGDVVGYDDYYPFGLQMPGRTYNLGLANDIYKYNGKELDEENDLDWYYFGVRYYDPAIGRWLQVDPLASKYPSLSPYVYCHNNPLIYIDPDGMADEVTHTSDPEYSYTYNGENSHTVTTTTSTTTTVTDGKNMIVTTTTTTASQTFTMNSDGSFTTTNTNTSTQTTESNYVMTEQMGAGGEMISVPEQVGDAKIIPGVQPPVEHRNNLSGLSNTVGMVKNQLLANGVSDGSNLFQSGSVMSDGGNLILSLSVGAKHPVVGGATAVLHFGFQHYRETADFTGKTGIIKVNR